MAFLIHLFGQNRDTTFGNQCPFSSEISENLDIQSQIYNEFSDIE